MKNRKWLALFAGIISVTIFLMVCLLVNARLSFPLPGQEERFRLTFVCSDSVSEASVSEYWASCIAGMQEACRQKNVSLSLMSADDSDYQSLPIIYDSAVLSGVDGILCVGANPEDVSPCIDKAMALSIPTICVDGDIPSSSRIAYVGTDNYGIGSEAAEVLLEGMKKKGSAHILYPWFTTAQIEDRIQGFCDIMEANQIPVTIHEETLDASILDYEKVVQTMLEEDPGLAGIFCPIGYRVSRFAKCLRQEEAGQDVCFVCLDDYADTLQAVQDGLIYATIAQKPYDMGLEAVFKMCQYLEDGSLPQENYYTDTLLWKN